MDPVECISALPFGDSVRVKIPHEIRVGRAGRERDGVRTPAFDFEQKEPLEHAVSVATSPSLSIPSIRRQATMHYHELSYPVDPRPASRQLVARESSGVILTVGKVGSHGIADEGLSPHTTHSALFPQPHPRPGPLRRATSTKTSSSCGVYMIGEAITTDTPELNVGTPVAPLPTLIVTEEDAETTVSATYRQQVHQSTHIGSGKLVGLGMDEWMSTAEQQAQEQRKSVDKAIREWRRRSRVKSTAAVATGEGDQHSVLQAAPVSNRLTDADTNFSRRECSANTNVGSTTPLEPAMPNTETEALYRDPAAVNRINDSMARPSGAEAALFRGRPSLPTAEIYTRVLSMHQNHTDWASWSGGEDGTPSTLMTAPTTTEIPAPSTPLFCKAAAANNHSNGDDVAGFSRSDVLDRARANADGRSGARSSARRSVSQGRLEDYSGLETKQIDRYGFIRKPATANGPSRPGSLATTTNGGNNIMVDDNCNIAIGSASTHGQQPGNAPIVEVRRQRSLHALQRRLSVSRTRQRASMYVGADMGIGSGRETEARAAREPELAEAIRVEADHLAMTAKEASRAQKWQAMAKPLTATQLRAVGSLPRKPSGALDTGRETPLASTEFDFDINSRLVRRAFKGIPDCWRAAAWKAFLRHSAVTGNGPREIDLVTRYRELLGARPGTVAGTHLSTRAHASSNLDHPNSPRYNGHDGVDHGVSRDRVPPCHAGLDATTSQQIELDVPRTISDHVLFRRRNRGGQAALSRLLHCIAMQFPDVGYVQGMASLGATLLCYYTEETAFVMLAWLWTERGMATLYSRGFRNLTRAHTDLADRMRLGEPSRGAIGIQLVKLGVTPDAFATRWYLTLFHHTVPFATQLRLWDVLMLCATRSKPYRVLEAGALALLDSQAARLVCGPTFDSKGTRMRKAGVEFDDAMHLLTKPLDVRDDDVLMKAVRKFVQ